MDPELPFFFPTNNERVGQDHPDFDQDDGRPRRLHNLHINAREDGSIFTAGRNYLPARDRRTIRQQIHRFDVGMPPPPENQLADINVPPPP